MQVNRHPIVTDRASELPSVAPAVVGKRHKYAYVGSSRVNDKSNWGPLQVSPLSKCHSDCLTSFGRVPLAAASCIHAEICMPQKYAYVGSSCVNDNSNWGPLHVSLYFKYQPYF